MSIRVDAYTSGGIATGVVERPGALLRDEQAEPAGSAVEVPRPSVAHLVLERGGLVLHREPHVVDPGVDQVGEGEVEQLVAPRERQRRFRALQREDVHAPAGTTGLHDRQDPRRVHGTIVVHAP